MTIGGFYEKAIPVKPADVAALTVIQKDDVCALTRASMRTVVGSASW
jgi:hypothetical protein